MASLPLERKFVLHPLNNFPVFLSKKKKSSFGKTAFHHDKPKKGYYVMKHQYRFTHNYWRNCCSKNFVFPLPNTIRVIKHIIRAVFASFRVSCSSDRLLISCLELVQLRRESYLEMVLSCTSLVLSCPLH